MATVASMLAASFDHYFWTGFYVVDPTRVRELVVGPYQGTLGCLRIAFGRGVCGTAAATGQTQLVEDVHAFPGHIACDSRSASEIVVPVFDGQGRCWRCSTSIPTARRLRRRRPAGPGGHSESDVRVTACNGSATSCGP
jgi:hypothetical protein